MSVVAKALELLNLFSASCPEMGLSQICRTVGRDKATTYRHLAALQNAGFIEQNPTTKAYRIGPAVLHLAQLREDSVPRQAGAQDALAELSDETGETAHVSVLSGTTLHTLAECESTRHSIRAVIDIKTLPLHATASGICAVAFGPADLLQAATDNLVPYTPHTPATKAGLIDLVEAARKTGFGSSDRGLEDNIHGLAAPVFDQNYRLAGSVAVASVANRTAPGAIISIKQGLVKASRKISHNWGGRVPDQVEAIWTVSLAHS
ncbi:MAG: IclR family transcriptional regulator [Pseudomonadota bacterium]